MATFSKHSLTGGTDNGRGIEVVATATAGTLIHTVPSSVIDEIWLYAANIHSSAVVLTVELGGVTTTSDLIQISIGVTPSGLVLVCPGLVLKAGLIIRAFAGTASKIEIFGYVNRIT